MKESSCEGLLCQSALVFSVLAYFLIALQTALAPSPTHFPLPTSRSVSFTPDSFSSILERIIVQVCVTAG